MTIKFKLVLAMSELDRSSSTLAESVHTIQSKVNTLLPNL